MAEELKLFSELNLSEQFLQAVAEMGFENATPIQSEAIPLIRTGVDVIAKSQTGTGKTVAFGIPALEVIDTHEEKSTIQVLILCPTRELAQQAGEEIRKLARFTPGIRPVEVYGGSDMERQFIRLRKANIVVGTPGRVMDHMRRGTIKFSNLKMVVLDEADEMLKMGFKEDIETILKDTPENRQIVLFSATMSRDILALTQQFQNDPQLIEINKSQITIENIAQSYVEVPTGRKNDALVMLLSYHRPNRSIIFCNTKRMVDELTEILDNNGFSAQSIHGDLKQAQRTSVMNGFKSGKISILVATDVAARGIDVNDIDYVFNYDIPIKTEYYVHRIGRTGRAGKSGSSITLCSGKRQIFSMRTIAQETKSEIVRRNLPTTKDLQEKGQARDLQKMDDTLKGEINERYQVMVTKLIEGGYTAEQIAVAALSLQFPNEAASDLYIPVPKEDRDTRDTRDSVQPPSRGKRIGGMYADIVINVGSANRVAPNHLVGAITEQSGLSGRDIGKIDIYPDQSVVGVPASKVNDVIRAMVGCKICGQPTETVPLTDQHPGHRARAPRPESKNAHFANQRVTKRAVGKEFKDFTVRKKKEKY
jgi:ATP-dependent RNA helicase DeaD